MKSQADAKSILTICLGLEKIQQAQNIFRENSGHLKMSEAIDKETSRYMLYKMRDMGVVEPMVKLGGLNSRVKDFYDVWLLTRQFDFEGGILPRPFVYPLKREKLN
jgi:hypothetical protein